MTPILDCESFEKSLECLGGLYEASVSEIEYFFRALDLDELYRARSIAIPGDQYLAGLFESKFGYPKRHWTKVRWFHLTRVPRDTDFAEGILPLQNSLPKIWKAVISSQAVPTKRKILQRLRALGVPDYQYSLKAGNARHGGPYGMLVKESAFRSAEMGNHDYLRMPEIVEDICNGYEHQTGECILEDVSSVLTPCIVKFEVESDRDDEHLNRVLLYYCWSKCRNEEMCDLSNTCFDGQGRVIPRSAILKVEFV